ncbi:hypothetical protein EST38_g6647 [Candolleomyces aberdarensis]|uniref:Arrestin C-terminal-like domain-containing protein n=1 Tax=Candolleomyces aberdarensis TaxID=2316362 RepID=A0A4Q2DH99_9AGAR|nr:hypothetical protein EST38_g6647 [Candolleomyces aberdarensis]
MPVPEAEESTSAHSGPDHPPGLFGRDPNVASFNPQKSKSRPREPITRVFGLTHEELKGKEEKKVVGNGWKEFKKGTYTYPISFTIPSTAPPTLQCDYGSVVWKLYAHVHRPGAFKTKFTATREVQVIACPTEEDTEDSENIIVERHWDQQLQYLISISGRSFHIGGTMPVTFAFMPLAKVKIHRLAVFIEERVDYYNNMRRVVRSDPLSRFHLLSVKHHGKHHVPILPLESDDVDALESSPLYELLNPEDDPSQVASELMGPGPWSFHHDLKLPASCNLMHFTNKNRRANMTISHLLKVVIRVERGDDLHVDKSGKRKLFDIVVQTPVQILSCRCNPDWTSLPRYEETFVRDNHVLANCPCQTHDTPVEDERTASDQSEIHLGPFHAHLPAALERIRSHHSNDNHNEDPSHGHAAGDHSLPHPDAATVQAVHPSETSAIDPAVMRSLRVVTSRDPQTAEYLRSNQQFERLVSGFESEFGEAPPSYECVAPGPSSPAIVVN